MNRKRHTAGHTLPRSHGQREADGGASDAQRRYPYPDWMALICHHDPQRSFFFRGWQLPVCARCTGIYGAMAPGFILGIPLTLVLDIGYWHLACVILLFLAPAVVDGVTQYMGWRESNNMLRLATGVMGGLAMGLGFGWLAVNIWQAFA